MKAFAGSMPRSIGADAGVRRRHAGGTPRRAGETAGRCPHRGIKP
ncbi:hypothetical protein [Burkholderia ubonensis]|nr:hypothetical protein [Burkholderia ubonensis]